jgi:hypothetical protein
VISLIKLIFELLGRNKLGQIIAATIIIPIVAVRATWSRGWTIIGYSAVVGAAAGFLMGSFFVCMEMRTERERAGRYWIPKIIFWPAMSLGAVIFIIFVTTMAFQPHPLTTTLNMFSSGQKPVHMREKAWHVPSEQN